MPIRAKTEAYTSAKNRTVVGTTQIGPQADSGSGQGMETKAPTPDNASVATTLIENPETAIAPSAYSIQSDERIIIEDTEIFIGPPYVDKSTGRRMIELLYFTPTGLHYDGVGLDDCEFIGCESIKPKSDDDEIEALFRYDGYKFWAQEQHLTFPASGDTFTVLHAVVGIENRLGEHRMAILQQGFNFFLDSITSMRKGEIAEFYVKDLDNAGDKQSEFSLSAELKDFYPLPAGYAPAHVGYNPRPENSQENAARPYLDLQSFGR
ncbi:hypothetical protein BDV33DRAFT_210410 [Aspergillus novoparasiticus]|uniref:Uncharacterized protein n=1 Tax=Aspergillus novoparasiticus TaxID=986946 RepID=A0A5N6E8U8_9EURO|nr:hypothetical protein BDV33DRAFT_210410 [Aspergillus novoparasiticus]